ncbi:protein fantom-like [Centruroides sculpturatus]|uniref:protein fantom-like n=1 Tax=Centruroides sculpturatus TaxID=218467 RepID=UPI000C6E1211|nr:protein fantom-like [Centruroides sculpturatus]
MLSNSVFYFDVIHADKREKLKNMLQSETEEENSLMFTVVSEPPEDRQDMDCEDIGYSFFNLKEILMKEEDFIDHEIKIVDANDQNTVIGKLSITIEAFKTLKTIQDES